MSLVKTISISGLPKDVVELIHIDHELLDVNIKALNTIDKDMILCYSNDTYIIYISKYLLDTAIEALTYTVPVDMQWSEFEDEYVDKVSHDIAGILLVTEDYTYFNQLATYTWNNNNNKKEI